MMYLGIALQFCPVEEGSSWEVVSDQSFIGGAENVTYQHVKN